jgi:hypothetical protein
MSKGKQLNGRITGDQEVLTREETLRILSEMTRKGSISAAIALERALRLDPGEEDDEDPVLAELDACRPTRQPRPRPS